MAISSWMVMIALSIIQFSSFPVSCWERVVTDQNLIHSVIGLAIDYRYNESLAQSPAFGTGLPSSPGCPRSVGGLPWVYVGNPPRCYLVGTSGPCSPGKLIFGNVNSQNGQCDCICKTGSRRELKSYPNFVRYTSQFHFCDMNGISGINGAVLDEHTGMCLFLETRGNCNRGQWMVKDKDGAGTTCITQCAFTAGPLSDMTFDYDLRKCIQKQDGYFDLDEESDSSIQLVSLGSGISHSRCDGGKIYSQLLSKCIARSKAFLMKIE